jgi:hypothetical protein
MVLSAECVLRLEEQAGLKLSRPLNCAVQAVNIAEKRSGVQWGQWYVPAAVWTW